jgi:AcrR family transcriptional regulator
VSRDRIICEAAAELFYQRGFAAVGVDEIGRQAGVTGPAIYRHFHGKDEILSALFEEGMDEVLRVTGGSFSDPHEELFHLARAHARHVLAHPRLASVWIREGRSLSDPYRRRYQQRAARYVERWRQCVQRCYPEAGGPSVASAVHLSLGLLNSLPSWPAGAKRAEDLPQSMARMVISGLRSLGGATPARPPGAAVRGRAALPSGPQA